MMRNNDQIEIYHNDSNEFMGYQDTELQMNSQFILRIEEIDNCNCQSPLDNCMFIEWNEHYYNVRGKRNDTNMSNFVPYAFSCKTEDELCKFIKFVIGKSKANVILYNYNNITNKIENKILVKEQDRTFEFFENNIDSNYEVAGYNSISLNKKIIMNFLAILHLCTF